MLQVSGYKVESVSSGEAAIAYIREQPVDVVVLDMLMKPGINGRQTYQEMLKINPRQRAIVASGFSESEDVTVTRQLGAASFIKKPYSMQQLTQAVKDALQGNRAGR
jgi:DNA-binding NtrC family response regulator